MKTVLALVCTLALASLSHGAIQTKTVEYKHGDATLVGYLVWDDAVATEKATKPGVVICPEWWGNNDYSLERARQLANLGYVAFAIDMYGKGENGKPRVTDDAAVAAQWSQEVMQDTKLRRERAAAGLKALTDQKIVDKMRLAAIGYCMGGTVALELARTGANLKAVVAFHASRFAADRPADNLNITGTVMICHGQADNFVPEGEVEKFHAQMKETSVDYVFIAYSGAVHAFTNKGADQRNIPGVRYDAKADQRSWDHMQALFAEKFARESA